jgi:lysophospholipase L1-like esterase
LQRIDVVAVDARGVAFLIPGAPSVMSPALPAVPRGATAIASVYRPFLAQTLEPAHVFPITARAGESPTATTRGRIPKTLRKLEAGEAVTVVCWGDSITVGADVEPAEAWANRVLAELQKKFPRAKINHRNHSIGGTKTAQWLHNGDFPGLPKQNPEKCRFENILAEKPDLVVMEFLNDIVFKEDILAATYQRIHEAFAARGIEWIIVTPSQKIPENFNLTEMKDEQSRLLDTFLRRFADRHGYALADAAARWKHLHREGIPYFALFNNAYNHPNAFGHQLFLKEIMQCFQP